MTPSKKSRPVDSPRYDFQKLEGNLKSLLRRGLKDGAILVREKNCGETLQAWKYFSQVNKFGMEILIYSKFSSDKHFVDLQVYCDEIGLSLAVIRKRSGEIEYLCIDCRQDMPQARRLIQEYFCNICGFGEDVELEVQLPLLSTWDEQIESETQRPMSLVQGFKGINKDLKQLHNISLYDITLWFFLSSVQLVASVLLIYRAFSLDEVRLENPSENWFESEDIILLVLILFGSLKLWTRTYWKRFTIPAVGHKSSTIKNRWKNSPSRYVICNKVNVISIVAIIWYFKNIIWITVTVH